MPDMEERDVAAILEEVRGHYKTIIEGDKANAEKLDRLEVKVDRLETRVGHLEDSVTALRLDVGAIRNDLGSIANRVTRLEERQPTPPLPRTLPRRRKAGK